jgi:hypothetical protein
MFVVILAPVFTRVNSGGNPDILLIIGFSTFLRMNLFFWYFGGVNNLSSKVCYHWVMVKSSPYSVIPGLTRNPVTLPFYNKKKNYDLPICNTHVAGYRLSPV